MLGTRGVEVGHRGVEPAANEGTLGARGGAVNFSGVTPDAT